MISFNEGKCHFYFIFEKNLQDYWEKNMYCLYKGKFVEKTSQAFNKMSESLKIIF